MFQCIGKGQMFRFSILILVAEKNNKPSVQYLLDYSSVLYSAVNRQINLIKQNCLLCTCVNGSIAIYIPNHDIAVNLQITRYASEWHSHDNCGQFLCAYGEIVT